MFNASQIMSIVNFFPLFSVHNSRLLRLRKHYVENGLVPLESKAGGQRPNTSISFEDTQKLVTFLQNYAEDHALLLPGRVPGVWKDDVVLLPSSHTKAYVYLRYQDAMNAEGVLLPCASVFT
jgi:hypothetical protein